MKINQQHPQLALLIDGEWITGGGRRERAVVNPATAEEIGLLPLASAEDIERAANISRKGFAQWQSITAIERGRILAAVANSIRNSRESLAGLLTREQGKTFKEALAEVQGAADIMEWCGEEGKRLYGRLVPSRASGIAQTVRLEPVGPVAAFSPWNYPLALAARKIGQALGAGCSVVIKPAEEAPSAVLEFARICLQCGVPPAALQVLFGVPSEVSSQLIASPNIRKISFTGSVGVGKQLAALAGTHLKKVTFELGGHSPVIIMDDIDIDRAVTISVSSKFRNAGQICIAPTRFFVHDSIYDRFIQKFALHASALKVGDGMHPDTDMGPLAHRRRLEAMEELVDDALRKGAKQLTGSSCALSSGGYFWNPTVLSDVSPRARLMVEEPFGPIASFVRFDDVEQAIAQANSVEYGLAGYAFTSSLKTARFIEENLNVGIVGLNTFAVTAPEMPFSGTKDSGLGNSLGIEGLIDHMNVKSVFEAA
jgi:succinate-semialdehyde dehydrogenase/glutarate-semialdehyde dehydrogenase